jgi:hypothetical protein
MSTMRYSGEIRIRITYLEPWAAGTPAPAGRSTYVNGEYRCFLSVVGGSDVTIHVGAPNVLSRAVDSPKAFDEVAQAALSFAFDDGWPVEAHAAVDGDDYVGWHIGRSPANDYPKEV